MNDHINSRLAELKLKLPESPTPRGKYTSVMIHDGVAHVSGQVSREGDHVITGPATIHTADVQLERAATACVLSALSALNQAIGSLDLVDRIVFVRGFVSSDATFDGHSRVLDHASMLLHAIFGERGHHARSAVGVGSLPSNGLLEIEVTAAISERT